jgi:hypothetical protein
MVAEVHQRSHCSHGIQFPPMSAHANRLDVADGLGGRPRLCGVPATHVEVEDMAIVDIAVAGLGGGLSRCCASARAGPPEQDAIADSIGAAISNSQMRFGSASCLRSREEFEFMR